MPKSRAIWLLGLFLALGQSACSSAPETPHLPGTANDLVGAEIGVDGTLRLARASMAGGDIDGGIKLLRQAAAANPTSIDAKRMLANAFYDVGAMPEAAIAFEAVRAIHPELPDGEVGLGRVALARGEADVAIERFDSALRLCPSDEPALNGLAVAYDFSGRHREAQVLYRQLLAKNPADHAVANNLAVSEALDGNLEAAIARLGELASGPAVLPQARFNLALAYGLNGKPSAARELLQSDLGYQAVAQNLTFYQAVADSVGPSAAP